MCERFTSTLVLLKTNHSKFIGLYSPNKWQNTGNDAKNIRNANKILQFYFSDKDLKIVKNKDDIMPQMKSDETYFLGFVQGI